MTRYLNKIKNNLWTYRKKMGLSQKKAALFACLRSNDLSRYEHGAKLPRLANALKLEIIYRIPVAFLFGDLYKQLKDEIRKREAKVHSNESGHERKSQNHDQSS